MDGLENTTAYDMVSVIKYRYCIRNGDDFSACTQRPGASSGSSHLCATLTFAASQS
jgi:hypothetical protein